MGIFSAIAPTVGDARRQLGCRSELQFARTEPDIVNRGRGESCRARNAFGVDKCDDEHWLQRNRNRPHRSVRSLKPLDFDFHFPIIDNSDRDVVPS